MRNLNTENKMFKLLDSPNEGDILIALEFMKDYTFDDLINTGRLFPSSGNSAWLKMYCFEKSTLFNPQLGVCKINDIEIDIWSTLIFFTKR